VRLAAISREASFPYPLVRLISALASASAAANHRQSECGVRRLWTGSWSQISLLRELCHRVDRSSPYTHDGARLFDGKPRHQALAMLMGSGRTTPVDGQLLYAGQTNVQEIFHTTAQGRL